MDNFGDNVARLAAHFVRMKIFPPSSGIDGVVEFFQDEELRNEIIENALSNTMVILCLIKSNPNNPYADDEEIAKMLLEKIDGDELND